MTARGRGNLWRWGRAVLWVWAWLTLGGLGVAQGGVGHIQVQAEPGVQVFLDDTFVGLTREAVGGLVIPNVPAGPHTLRLVKEGFYPQEGAITVETGRVLVYRVERFALKLRITEEGEAVVGEPKAQVGTLIIQCLPIECVIDIPLLEVHGYRKTGVRWKAEGVPAGVYDLTVRGLGRRVEQRVGVCSGSEVMVLQGHTGAVRSLVFSSDGTLLATGGFDCTIRLWEVGTGRERAVLKGHADLIYGVAFSPDGARLASASSDRTVRLWALGAAEAPAVLEGYGDGGLQSRWAAARGGARGRRGARLEGELGGDRERHATMRVWT
ncbi:hypothetical protein [Marinithermus hydrothermalis]|uniref:WD40 repeat-containing protein n=1 Tax=Marinithermus hydrothermalis (strain DSM 14884 / JCM 11576 / T1) TaxID=869210 RepID=F2NQ00_MARHT|nr:hypothetical protein [Marinithermus hydrothermalis]AEB11101.1 WD40 repeat-containing protein [Marinithermus hydrothermalis DSM 14884]